MLNRNVVSRPRPEPPRPNREAARTLQFDCSAIAALSDEREVADDADIEIGNAAAASEPRAKERFVRTLKRAATSDVVPVLARSSNDAIPTAEISEHAASTMAMSAQAAQQIADEVAAEIAQERAAAPRSSRSWMILSAALFAGSVAALVAVVI